MVLLDYNGATVDWTDGEWARIREIKDAPGWRPRRGDGVGMAKIGHSVKLPPLLLERAKEYAAQKNISFAGLVEVLLKTIVE